MSVRYLYRIPVSQRICSYYLCRKRILRNIDRDKNGNIYHHGCLQNALEDQFHCLDCFSSFDATEASFTEKQQFFNDDFRAALKPICPNCGSSNIKPLGSAELEFTVKHHTPPFAPDLETGKTRVEA